ncbi:MAG: hypothetical protein ABSA45_04435 [Verrucomicrobiota bacterium]
MSLARCFLRKLAGHKLFFDFMDTITFEILAAAPFFTPGNAACFEMSLPGPTGLLPLQTVSGEQKPEGFADILEPPPVSGAQTTVEIGVPWKLKKTGAK